MNLKFTTLRSVVGMLVSLSASLSLGAANWPGWRGPLGTGITQEKNLPVQWSATENVKWRVALPEPANSTPVVWGDRIFVTQAVGGRRTLMCFNRADGQLLWQAGVPAKGKEPTHGTNPYCSASPVTDGERVIAWFGSDGLHGFDYTGKKLWSVDLGRQRHLWGYGASPVIQGELCFLNFGPGERQFLVAVETKSGREVWRHDEPGGDDSTGNKKGAPWIGSWTTPTPMLVEGRDQLLLNWPKRLAAYDLQTGKELWTCAGLNDLSYTSPVYADGIVVAMGGFSGMSLAARAGGSGDITASRRLWHHPKTRQRIGSGVIHDGHIYIHSDPGVAECFELKTGRLVWEERLKGAGKTGVNWSSVMLSGDHCYTITQGGDCFVFKASPKFEVVSVNSLGERSNSTIVPCHGELFIRTHQALWCIAAMQ